jgi:hypothetical protein
MKAVHAILPLQRGLPKTAFGAEAGVIYQQFKIRRRRDARFDPGQIAFQR